MQRIVHPGPIAAARAESVRTQLLPISGTLRAGETVMAEVARLFAEAGCLGGVLFFEGGLCDPYRYVLPALSTDGDHAAWYSATFSPEAGATILSGTAIVGRKAGATFLHCHGHWDTGADGVRMGHMLPLESVIVEPFAVTGLGSTTATFEALPDEETHFTLFSPRGQAVSGDALFLRIRPNEDVSEAIEAACRAHGIAAARVHGIGSIAEVFFEDGRSVPCIATELVIEDGRVMRAHEGPKVRLDVSVVDIDGAIHRGVLRHGNNPVGVTFELVIVQDSESGER